MLGLQPLKPKLSIYSFHSWGFLFHPYWSTLENTWI